MAQQGKVTKRVASQENMAIEHFKAELRANGYSLEERALLVDGFVSGWRAAGGPL